MSALVRKEIRLVLPAWIAAMVLAVFPIWLLWPGSQGYFLESPGASIYALFSSGVLLLGLASFGQELNHKTFSILLAQPVSRRRLWLVKTTILAAALGLAFLALCLSLHLRVESVIEALKAGGWRNLPHHSPVEAQMLRSLVETRRDAFHDSIVIGGLCALAAFSSGLWTNLFFRNTSAAFWFSLLIPLGLGMLATALFGGLSRGLADGGLIFVLGAYSAAGWLWARMLFLQVEDTQWTGGVLSFPMVLRVKAAVSAQTQRPTPFRALIRKEFQLHQINVIIAGLLVLSHLVVIAVRRMNMDYFAQHRSASMMWESWPLLWLVMPFLISGVAVAEERKLGTLEGFLCLPVTRRRGFLVKFVMAMLLGVVFGGVMPLAVEWLGTLIGLPEFIFDTPLEFNWKLFSLAAGLLGGSAGFALLAFYASTLTRNLLQALGLAVVLSFIASSILTLAMRLAQGAILGELPELFWRGPFFGLVGWPVMIVTLILLAFGNFKQLNIGGKIWSRNFLTLLASLVGAAVVTTVIHHRTWELWMPDEPVHRFGGDLMFGDLRDPLGSTRQFTQPKMEASLARVAVVFPDGRLWMRQGRLETVERDFNGTKSVRFRASGSWHEGFIEGSDWREIAVVELACFAIQADGSLWDLSEVQPGSGKGSAKRFGEDHDWKAIAAGGGFTEKHFVTLKTDGTIWQWGAGRDAAGQRGSTGKNALPARVGMDSNWTAVCDSLQTTAVVKNDGSIWRFRGIPQFNATGVWKVTKNVEQPEKWFSPFGHHPVSLSLGPGGDAIAAVCDDGTLWVGGNLSAEWTSTLSYESVNRARHEMVQLEMNANWKEVRFFRGGSLAAVTRSGELWDRAADYTPEGFRVVAWHMPSRYRDWVAVCSGQDGSLLALTAEGRICRWGNPWNYESFYPDFGSLLMPSRIKARTIAEIRK